MFHRIHQKLGTAGFVISIVALIAALGGGAYAAGGGLTGKQKKEVEKIAKKYAGTPGAAGAAGAAGPVGAKGDAGANGANGTNGANGASVTVTKLNPGNLTCPAGGAEFKVGAGSAGTACNGEEGAAGQDGSPWTVGGVLPSGESETGAWTIGPFGGAGSPLVTLPRTPVSFNIPVAGTVTAHFIEETPTTECPGTTEAPEALPGNLCIYKLLGSGFTYTGSQNPETGQAGDFVGKSGALLIFEHTAAGGKMSGNWIVTAP